jgi:hypothetical protein
MPKARWNGPFDAMLPDRRMVRVGDVIDVPESQLASAHWQALPDSPPAAKATPTASTSEGGDD